MPQVACVGILVADVVGKTITAFPPTGTLAAVERMELHVGGCAANTGLALARLGAEVSVLGRVGRDGFGDFVRQTLQNGGVNTEGVLRGGQEATSATMVAVDAAGERTFLHYPGANAVYEAADIVWPLIDGAEILHVAGPFLMPHFIGDDCTAVLRRAKSQGKTTTLDTVWDHTGRWMETLSPSLPFVDYLLPSWEEARRLTGRDTPHDIAQVLLDGGVQVVGLKMGDRGAFVRTARGEEFTAPAFPVTAVDSLGAGDAWVGGFIRGLLNGWDLERIVRFANAVGACAVQGLGATTGIRSFEETMIYAFNG